MRLHSKSLTILTRIHYNYPLLAASEPVVYESHSSIVSPTFFQFVYEQGMWDLVKSFSEVQTHYIHSIPFIPPSKQLLCQRQRSS